MCNVLDTRLFALQLPARPVAELADFSPRNNTASISSAEPEPNVWQTDGRQKSSGEQLLQICIDDLRIGQWTNENSLHKRAAHDRKKKKRRRKKQMKANVKVRKRIDERPDVIDQIVKFDGDLDL